MVPRMQGSPQSIRRFQIPGICLFLAGIVWLVFGQTLWHDFVSWDDQGYVTQHRIVKSGLTLENVARAFTDIHADNWHPLTTLSHMLDCQLYGLHPAGHHLTNLLLHAASAIGLFLVLRRMTGAVWRSAFVAAVFAVHPLRVESVAWVAERKDVLSGFLFMLTLGGYVRYVQTTTVQSAKRRFWYGWTMGLFIAGLMCKPMLVTLPFVLLLLDYWPFDRLRRPVGNQNALWISPQVIKEKIPLLALSILACATTLWAQQRSMELPVSLTERVGNAVVSYACYLWQMLYPTNLAAYYPHPGQNLPLEQVVVALLALAVISVAIWRWRRRQPWLAVGWLWYLGMLVPVIGLIQVGSQARADRYTYLPQIGIYWLLTWAVSEWCTGLRCRRLVLGGLSITVVAAFMLCARVQASCWRDSVSLWSHALACTQDNMIARGNLGDALLQAKRPGEAIVQYREVLRIQPRSAQALFSLGKALADEGQTAEAISCYEEGLQVVPLAIPTLNDLAWILATSPVASLRNGLRAVELAEKAQQISGGRNASVFDTLAAAYAEAGRFPQAVETARAGLALATGPDNEMVAEGLRTRLALYKAGLPYRQTLQDSPATSKEIR